MFAKSFMKKALAIIAALLLALACYQAGRAAGIRQAFGESQFWILEWDKPEGADLTIHILTGDTWTEHDCYIG